MSELCRSLELFWKEPLDDSTTKGVPKSIVDPRPVEMKGPQTTSTSSKVDRTAPKPKTKMVERIQMSKPNEKSVGVEEKTTHLSNLPTPRTPRQNVSRRPSGK